ncbi:MAG: Glu-tRNA(Gln) amidotransferase subunit GatD [Candidatus Micrarchaeota archaeon]|nr:Glu-tRNA(Gln) amidotransferase subunit GatD [Candidatus Micrarchaeota archaeon]
MPKPKKESAREFSQGDEVKLIAAGTTHQGILLPRNETDEFLTLKLASGYNMGISKKTIEKIELVHKKEARPQAPASKMTTESWKGKTVILGCGGTIASRIDYKTGAVYPASTPEELIASFPSIDSSKIGAKTLFSLLSEDISPAHWGKIAEATTSAINDGAKGIVITHGTDTMSFTSAALSFMLPNLPCPVVMTGSQRSSDRGSSDSEVNMRASLLAAEADLSGVFVCMHENLSDDSCLLHFGAKVRKMHTSRRDAFHSMSCLPAARITLSDQKLQLISERTTPRKTGKAIADTKLNTNVALLYTYPGLKPSAISSLSEYDGVVIAGTGLGHIPINLGKDPLSIPILKEVKALIDSGTPVVMAPQALYGRVNMNTYATGRLLREAGIIGQSCDFTPEAAYVKLMWVLGHEKNLEKVRELMETSLAGEITPRSEIADY